MSSNKRRFTEGHVLGLEGFFLGVPGESDNAKSLAKSAGSVRGGKGKNLRVVWVWCNSGVRILFCEEGVSIKTLGRSGRVGK